MPVPRMRLTTRRVLIAIAVLALVFGGVRRFAQRSYPNLVVLGPDGSYGMIQWSDGSTTMIDENPGQFSLARYRYWTWARWPDGSRGFYLHPVAPVEATRHLFAR